VGTASASRLAGCLRGAAIILIPGLLGSGCTATVAGPTANLADVRGVTVAIESVEGAPPQVFHRFVRDLNVEAASRDVALVLWGGGARYRLRGYLAARADTEPTSIAWAWDIYDTGQRHLYRVSGEERAPPGRKSWAAADDAVLRRIASAGMDQLLAFIASGPPPDRRAPASPPAAPARGPSIAAVFDDFRPEAAGVFRLLASEAPAVAGAASERTDAPVPRARPYPGEPAALASGGSDR
jgi:hypothetical protein